MANGKIEGKKILDDDVFTRLKKLDTSLLEIIKTLSLVESTAKKANSSIGLAKAADANTAAITKGNEALNARKAALQEAAELEKQRTQALLNAEKVEKAKQQTAAAAQRTEAALLRTKQTQLRLDKQLASNTAKTSSFYKQQSALLNKLRDAYKSLELKKIQGIKITKTEQVVYEKLRRRVTALNAALVKTDAAAGQFNRNVGNYAKGTRLLVGSLRSLAGAFGFTGGIFLFAAALRDAFKRVKEFDKSMQNLAGIMRTSRKDLREMESLIIKIAGASIKTSREVAELAESLVVLGKSEEDVKKLLKPVNDLAIALNANSGEAAEFFVQTLNAFGATADEAERYADVIATIRTSTSLDFQKMRDSFQYLTPISRILNKDLAYTGAIIGIMADNGLKAEQAGRLLGTAQQKLAKSNLSLVDALELVNEAQAEGKEGVELLAIASDLFGKQAAKVGIILARNSEEIEINAQAIRDNGGALDDLVDQQLQSVDAHVKILESTWETLILTIDNGTGSISKFFKGVSLGLTGYLEELTEVEQAESDIFGASGAEEGSRRWTNTLSALTMGLVRVNTSFEDLVETQREFNRFFGELDNKTTIPFLTDEVERLNAVLRDSSKLSEDEIKLYISQRDKVEKLLNTNISYRHELENQARAIIETTGKFEEFGNKIDRLTNEQLTDFIAANRDVVASLDSINEAFDDDITTLDRLREKLKALKETFGATDVNSDLFKTLKKEIRELEKEISRLSGTSKRTKQAEKEIIEGSVGAYKKLITELKDQQGRLVDNVIEYDNYNKKIEEAEKAIKRLTLGLVALSNAPNINFSAFEGSELDKEAQADFAEGFDKVLQDKVDAEILAEKQSQEAKEALRKGELENIKFLNAEQTRIVQDALQIQQRLQEEKAQATEDLIFGSLDTLFQARVDSVNDEIELNQNQLSAILSNEDASLEQKKVAKEAAEALDAQLQKKKEKREKQAFLVQQAFALAEIAINLAKTISAINLAAAAIDTITFGIGGTPYRIATIPQAVTVAALQSGLVLAQSIPAFFKGKNPTDNYEGLATWGEKRKEVKIGEDGSVEVSPNRTTLLNVKKKDIITPSLSAFNMAMDDPNSDIFKRVVGRQMKADTHERMIFVKSSEIDTKGIQDVLRSELRRQSKRKQPIHITYNNEGRVNRY